MSNLNSMSVRDANASDSAMMATLMNQLGYPTTEAEMQQRFAPILVQADYKTLLAELRGKVVGMAGLVKSAFYERNGSYVRVAVLVVDQAHRQQGVGRRLMLEAEHWARQQGALALFLTSGNRPERAVAHVFYQQLGFVKKSSAFTKELPCGSGSTNT